MDQYLFVEPLPSGASKHSKSLQQSKIRSHVAAIRHRKSTLQGNALQTAETLPEYWKQHRSTWTAAHRIFSSPQHLRPHVTKHLRDVSDSDYVDAESRRASFKHWQLAKRFNTGPRSLLSASRRDPFGTYPVSKPVIRFGQLLDFGKSYQTYESIPASNG